jgi:DNA-binding CsgD family transcriptional regulator
MRAGWNRYTRSMRQVKPSYNPATVLSARRFRNVARWCLIITPVRQMPCDGAVGEAFLKRRAVVLDNYPSAPNALPWAVPRGVLAAAAVPLSVDNRTIGVLAVRNHRSAPYTAQHAQILTLLAAFVAPALEVVRLYERERALTRDLSATALDHARLLGQIAEHTAGLEQLAARIEVSTRGMGTEPLTVRDVEILRLIATGMTNREIGAALHLSPGTVRNRIGRLLGKLGATDRTQAAVLALARGLL